MNQAQDKYGHTRKVLLVILSILAVIPLAPLINRYVPPLVLGDWNLDLTGFHHFSRYPYISYPQAFPLFLIAGCRACLYWCLFIIN